MKQNEDREEQIRQALINNASGQAASDVKVIAVCALFVVGMIAIAFWYGQR